MFVYVYSNSPNICQFPVNGIWMQPYGSLIKIIRSFIVFHSLRDAHSTEFSTILNNHCVHSWHTSNNLRRHSHTKSLPPHQPLSIVWKVCKILDTMSTCCWVDTKSLVWWSIESLLKKRRIGVLRWLLLWLRGDVSFWFWCEMRRNKDANEDCW